MDDLSMTAFVEAVLELRPTMNGVASRGDLALSTIIWGEVEPITEDELRPVMDAKLGEYQERALRDQRDALLSSSDWTQLPDSPLEAAKRSEWAGYRQALRDLPANTTDPASPIWPTPPA